MEITFLGVVFAVIIVLLAIGRRCIRRLQAE